MNNTSETSLQFHKITTRKEAEDFVYASYLRAASHQDYAAKDARKRHPELTRSLLWQKSVTPCIVVTGSKGKGSVSNMISRILQTRFSVGLMTSPHITDFRERFRVNDTMISESDFCRLMTEIQPEILNIASDLPESVCISPMGIQADLILFHPYDRWGYSRMNLEQQNFYLRYVVNRFSAYHNVWWAMANEFQCTGMR